MAKATTLNKSGAKIVKASLKDAAIELANAFKATSTALATAEAEYAETVNRLKSPLLALVAKVAARFPGCTLEQFKDEFSPAFIEAYGDEKKARGNLIKLRTAFLGLSNGVELGDATNLQKFASEVAHPALVEQGIIQASKAGRKKGTTSEESGSVDVLNLFAREFKGDKKTMRARIAMLAAIVEGDPSGKLFDKHLADMCSVLGVEV